MDLHLAFIKNDQQFLLRNLDNNEKSLIMPLTEVRAQKIDALFIPQELSSIDEVNQIINSESAHYPIKVVSTETLSADDFDKLEKEKAIPMFESLSSSWILNNNIRLVDSVVTTANHLKGLWPNDRTAFFEELWNLMRKNLGSQKLTIAYNHLRKAQKEGEKNQLIRVIVEGEKSPNPVENKELGEMLFNNYDKKFTSSLEIVEQNENQQVLLVTINDSPVIIMSHGKPVSLLQKSSLKALIDVIQIGN